MASSPNETHADETNKEKDGLGLGRVTEDELRSLRRARERQLDDAVAQLRVGLYHGLFGTLGFSFVWRRSMSVE